MYGSLLPRATVATTGIGVAMTAYRAAWYLIAFFVLAGTLLTVAKLFPRVAVEPIARRGRRSRWRLTVNGRPLGGRHRS